MKHLQTIILAIVTVVFSACQGQNNSQTIATDSKDTKIEVIDFYGTHRCVTCKAIEANTKYTLDTFFKDEMENGKLEFKTVNVDDQANYGMAERFEATGTALFINVIKDGQEHHIDLTDLAFAKGKDKEAFSKELKAKLEAELAKI